MCDSWFLNWAPCPPFFVDDVYVLYITFASKQNLSNCEVETVREKCGIDVPTTTSTTTTTTTTTATTTPSTTTSTTTIPPTTETINVTDTPSITNESTSVTIPEVTENTTVTNASTSNTTTISGTLSDTNNTSTFQTYSTPTSDLDITTNNITGVQVAASSSSETWCSGVCQIGVYTAVACLAIILIVVFATLVRKLRDDGKRERGRSRSRSRKRHTEVPNTELYDSVDLHNYSNRSSGSEMWHDSSDYSLRSVLRHDPSDYSTKEHTFVNPAFRRSFESGARSSVSWYDPDAANPDYLQRNANLTRKSRSPERKSLPITLLNNQKEVDKYKGRSRSANHISLREYVPKAVQYVDNFEQLPYEKFNGNPRNDTRDTRGKSPGKRSLPRTPVEVVKHTSVEAISPHQRPSYRRSRSYDLDAPQPIRSRDEDGFHTVDTRHSKQHYMKNSQRNKQTGFNSRDKSVKGQLHRNGNGDTDEVFMSPQVGHSQIQRMGNHGRDVPDNRVLSSNLRPGSYKYRSQQTVRVRDEPDNGYTKHSRSRSHKELRDFNSPNTQTRRGEKVSSYRPLNQDCIYVYQTKL